MSGMMDGKVAVVTGAGGGIGREIALMMAAAGAKVIVADIGASLSGEGGSASPAQQTKQLIEQKGGAAEICTESVSAWGSAQKIVQAALDHFGRIDAVVNNAGILRDVIFHKMTEDDWLSVIAVHLNGSFFVSRAAAEHYRKQESGTFVHMSSTSGLDRKLWPSELLGGQAGDHRLVQVDRAGHEALQRSLQLHRAICLEPDDQFHSRDDAGAAGEVGEDPADDAGQECADGGLSFLRRGEARHRAGVRLPDERDDPVQFTATDPDRAPVRRLDAGDDRGTLHPSDGGGVHAARPLRGRVWLGSGLDHDRFGLIRIAAFDHGLSLCLIA